MKNWMLTALTDAGYKRTAVRKRITAFLAEHKGIFSAQDIMRKLPSLDKISVYRTIELLAAEDMIHPVSLMSGMQYYEAHGNKHHHHAICTGCKSARCVDCRVPNVKVSGFKKLHHTFLFTGLCVRCAKAA